MRMKPSIDEMPHMRQAFRDRLVGQLHELTGGMYSYQMKISRYEKETLT